MALLMSLLLAAGTMLADDTPLAGDEAWCNQQRPNQKAVIRVSAGDDGTIRVEPDTCTVAPGARLVWIAPKGTAFEVVFADDTPDEDGRPKITSQSTAKEERISIRSRRADSRQSFAYDVVVEGEMLDPVVIIDPTLR
jgi:plastocyanin